MLISGFIHFKIQNDTVAAEFVQSKSIEKSVADECHRKPWVMRSSIKNQFTLSGFTLRRLKEM